MVLPASIAHSTASSAAVPDEAHKTMSTSGCEAISQRPSLPTPETSPGDPPSAARSLSIASPVAIATARGRNSRICFTIAATFVAAAIATTSTRSRCVRATSSALVPIDPVEPRIAMRFMSGRIHRLHGLHRCAVDPSAGLRPATGQVMRRRIKTTAATCKTSCLSYAAASLSVRRRPDRVDLQLCTRIAVINPCNPCNPWMI